MEDVVRAPLSQSMEHSPKLTRLTKHATTNTPPNLSTHPPPSHLLVHDESRANDPSSSERTEPAADARRQPGAQRGKTALDGHITLEPTAPAVAAQQQQPSCSIDSPPPRVRRSSALAKTPSWRELHQSTPTARLDAGRDTEALSVVAGQRGLVKTVRNGDWLTLLFRLTRSAYVRTSFSLLPPSGRMYLYGREHTQSTGLLYDLDGLNVEPDAQVLAWPSGFFAKTEFHMHQSSDGVLHMDGNTQRHLCSIDQLKQANAAHEAADGGGADLLQYNEVSLAIQRGGVGLVAVFVRTFDPRDLLFALGVRAMVQHVFRATQLPLLRITPSHGAELIPRAEILGLLSSQAHAEQLRQHTSTLDGGSPRLPIDTLSLPELAPLEILALHAAHGVSATSLATAISRAAVNLPLPRLVVQCLLAAAARENVASAREVVRCAAPMLLQPLMPRANAPRGTPRGGSPLAVSPVAPRRSRSMAPPSTTTQQHTPANVRRQSSATSSRTSTDLTVLRTALLESVAELRDACKADAPAGILVALGAQIVLVDFVSGRTARRLEAACDTLKAWLNRAETAGCGGPSISGAAFCFASWMEAREMDGNSDMQSFFSGKAVANRRRFLGELQRLQRVCDGLEYLELLYQLVSGLRKPCLRLRVLQQVLGLDGLGARFNRDIVHGVICLGYDVVEAMAGLERPGRAAAGSFLEHLDKYDEATRLEADSLLGGGGGTTSAPLDLRPSDPVGEAGRQSRIQYHYR